MRLTARGQFVFGLLALVFAMFAPTLESVI
jgi:hypothetical protein